MRGRRLRPAAALVAVTALTACSAGPADRAAPASTSSPAAGTPSAGTPSPGSPPTSRPAVDLAAALSRLEQERGARVGVFAVDTGTGQEVVHRADERTAYASTFKALLAGVVLERSTPEQLDEVVPFVRADLVDPSPVTSNRLGTGMTVAELCAAAVSQSDNGAANLLLERVGGPAGLDAALAALGDDVVQVVRTEPGLNSAVPGDPRDTTTPRALATTVRAMTLGDALEPDDRAALLGWMRAATTGAALVRSVVPADWVVGDKTGTGRYGTRNVVAVVEPPGRAPVVVAVMTTHDDPAARPDDGLVAETARIALRSLGTL